MKIFIHIAKKENKKNEESINLGCIILKRCYYIKPLYILLSTKKKKKKKP